MPCPIAKRSQLLTGRLRYGSGHFCFFNNKVNNHAIIQFPGAQAPSDAAGKRRGRPRKTAEPAAAAAKDGEVVDGDEDDDEDVSYAPVPLGEPGAVGPEPYSPPVQIKQQFWLRNRGK